MSLRTRLSIATAAGLLAAPAAVTPASAYDDWDPSGGNGQGGNGQGWNGGNGHHDQRLYEGVVTTDGTWAWGAARYIDNIGPAPRWC
ncbi:hypothetical protein ABZ214_23660 [Streptomyces iakyrus]|uniref:hypothetical protein n=1 Tax=Streptomyces iakyrus TaxID=68219 RepID=UPI0033A40BFE